MSVALVEPRILHVVSGRVRIHVPGWSGQARRLIETQLSQIEGVYRVQANALTSNILVFFDPTITNEQTILDMICRLDIDTTAQPDDESAFPPIIKERHGKTIRARIAVRGLDRDPHLAQRVIEHLERRPGVRARANLLTGRVLVEFAEHVADIDDLVAEIAGLELPPLPDEDRPAHPLDLGPLVQSATRTVGATLGLGLLAGRRLTGFEKPLPGAGVAIQVASVFGILQGIAPLRFGLRNSAGANRGGSSL